MKILRALLLILLVLILVLVVGGYAIYTDTLQGPLPQISGELNVAGLQSSVEVLRDDWGVPHIYADNTHDLFFAQGFVQAQDRWWQMEFNRHIGRGRIGELTGLNQSVLGNDLFIRTVGWQQAAERDLAVLSPQVVEYLQSFSDGVNAYITSRPADDLALEYRLLGVTGVNITVEPWTPLDSIAWGKVLSWDLTSSFSDDIQRQVILEALGEDMLVDYSPPFPYDQMPTILQAEDLPLSEESLSASIQGHVTDTQITMQLVGGYIAGDPIAGMLGRFNEPGIGSNNWVATNSMTESGTPLLANDPHLSIGMPSIWYEVGLHCLPVTDACPIEVGGFATSATPGVIIGHNANIAWGVTNVGADVQDVYMITVNPDNPLQYEWNGEWRDMTVREEVLQFGDNEPTLTMQVRETHLGPIINDNDYDSETHALSGFNNENPMALRWTGIDTGTLLDAVMGLNLAENWDDFRAALSMWSVPSQNFVYADVEGNIGYQTPGQIPYRPEGMNGTLPVPGNVDTYEWQGFIPFDDLPRVYNPPRDYIVTANQAVVPLEYYEQLADTLGEGMNYELSYDWSYGYRGERINQLIEEYAPHSVETYSNIQGDNKGLFAEDIMPYLADLDLTDASLQEVRDWLGSWDFVHSADSQQALYFTYFIREVMRHTYNDQLPEDITPTNGNLYPLVRMMEDADNVWWDDVTTSDVTEDRDTILTRALQSALDSIHSDIGTDRTEWVWGNAHSAVFVSNPLGLSGINLIEDLVNRTASGVSGGYEIVNATSLRINSDDFGVSALPSMRYIADPANWDNTRTIHTTGQSGHPASPYYTNMIQPWVDIEYHNFHWTREAVEAAVSNRLVLNPAP